METVVEESKILDLSLYYKKTEVVSGTIKETDQLTSVVKKRNSSIKRHG